MTAKTGKNPFVKRHTLKTKRRRATAVVSIASPRSQALQNSERAAQASIVAHERKRRVNARQEEERVRKEEEERFNRAEQTRVAQAAIALKPVPSGRALSSAGSARKRQGSAATSRATPTRPAPKPVVSFEELHSAHCAFSSAGFSCVLEEVRARRDAAVLCANGGGKIETWNTLPGAPSPEDDTVAGWRKWLAPANWRGFIDMCAELNPDAVADDDEVDVPAREVSLAAVSGAYNSVVTPSATAKLDDAQRWPPQLAESGRAGAFVVRMTKTRPFPTGPPGPHGTPPSTIYRFMPLNEMVLEMALALYAASLDVGPPVLAAVSWPESIPGCTRLLHGLLLVLGRARGDMIDYQSALRSKFPPSSYVSGPSEAFGNAAVEAAKDVARLCYRTAREGFLNFDIKPANMLWHVGNSFHLCDFDPTHFVHVSSGVASMKAAFFVNMILLCMHVRSHSSDAFASVFLGAVSQGMLVLWREAVRQPELFGAGVEWLKDARLPLGAREGCFCARELHLTKNVSTRCRRHFEMLVFEYGFSSSEGRRPPKRCTDWPGWNRDERGSSKSSPFFPEDVSLVRQLLLYCFFFDKPPPAELASILGNSRNAR